MGLFSGWFTSQPAPVATPSKSPEEVMAERKELYVFLRMPSLIQENEDQGYEITPEFMEILNREALLEARIQIERDDRANAAIIRESQESANRHAEIIEAIQDNSAIGQASKFAQSHPFLAGFLAADAYDRIKKD